MWKSNSVQMTDEFYNDDHKRGSPEYTAMLPSASLF